MELGRVDSLFIGPEEGGPIQRVASVSAVAGQGLEGDRYFHGPGEPGDPALEITLIEVEPIESALEELGFVLDPIEMRRNVVTRGVTLRSLLGKRFFVGDVCIEALGDNPSCRRLEKLTGKPVLKPFIDKGGIRGRIVEGGTIRVGDAISLPTGA